jgi:hypothetical protein
MMELSDLQALDEDVSRALRTRDTSHLQRIGHGEITTALGWPQQDPQFVCKRLPPFDSVEAATVYGAVVNRYVVELRRRGVRVVETEVKWFERPDGRVLVYHIQPALPSETLGLDVLRQSTPSADHPLLCSVVDTVLNCTGDGVGIDAQISNWAWIDGEPWQLDLSTPMMVNDAGKPAFDMTPFVAVLPAVIRPVVRQEMAKLICRWLTPRDSLMDLAANVIKANLEGWIGPVLECINERIDESVNFKEAERIYKADRRMFPLLLVLGRTNRFWQEQVRRRPYEFLLPESTTYKENGH